MIRVVFFGTEKFALRNLIALHDASNRFEIIAVVTQPPRPVGRTQTITPSPVHEFALTHNISVLTPETLKTDTAVSELRELNADVFVVAQYGLIIPQNILHIPKHGAVNVHGSLLPKYRGASPAQAALLAGDATTGVCFMVMDAKMDHGPVFATYETPIASNDTTETLLAKLGELAGEHLADDLVAFLDGTLKSHDQIHDAATFTKLLSRESGYVDWNTMNAVQIERMTRALSPWPGVTTQVQGKKLKIVAAYVDGTTLSERPGTILIDKSGLIFVTISGTLVAETLQIEGKPAMSAQNFCNGYGALNGIQCDSLTTDASAQ